MKCIICGKQAIYAGRVTLLGCIHVELCCEHDMAFQTAEGVTDHCNAIDAAKMKEMYFACLIQSGGDASTERATRRLLAEAVDERNATRSQAEAFVKKWLKDQIDATKQEAVPDADTGTATPP